MEESRLKIKRITISGMHKILQSTYNFNDAVTYFIGPNGVGKSTVLEAVQLALLGYIPGYGKTNESIMKHASGPVMSVSMEFDNGIIVERTWKRNGSSVSATESVKGYDKKEFPNLIKDIELPIFNFNEFATMTANKLKEWFISFLPSNSESLDIVTHLKNVALADGLPAEDLIASVENWIKTQSVSGLDLIKALDNYLKEGQSYVKGQISKLQGTVESLVRYDEADNLDESEIRSQLVTLEITQMNLVEYEAKERMQQQLRDKLNAAKSRLEFASLDEDLHAAEIRNHRKELENQIDALKGSLSKLDEDRAKVSDLQAQLSIMQADYSNVLTEIVELNRKRLQIPQADAKCPYTSEPCETAAQLSSKYAAELAEIDKQIDFKEEESADFGPEKMDALRKQISDMNSQISKTDHDIFTQINKATAEIHDCDRQLADIQRQYYDVALMEEQIVDIGPRPTQATQAELDSQLRNLRSLITKIEANKQYEQLMSTVSRDKFKLETDLAVLKNWAKHTGSNGLQSKLMNKPFEDMADDMSSYLTSMFGTPTIARFNLEAKANSFSFGMIRNNKYIEFDCLSSGEKCLFTLALIMCILNRSESQVKTIIIDDSLDHLDSDNAIHLFETLSKIEGIQFILAGVKECSNAEICVRI